jgi:hypothetical protein
MFKVENIHAFDLDQDMVRRTIHQQRRALRKPVAWVGNARALPVAANRYDAVFTFGAIHHALFVKVVVA